MGVGTEVLGTTSKVVLAKEYCTIVGDGSGEDAVKDRIKQIKVLYENAEAEYEKEKLNERIARLSGGVAIVQVGAQTETELKEKKLAAKVADIRDTLDNDEQKIGADIVERALGYPLKLIAENAGTNGSVVMERVQEASDPNYGFNAATGQYEDLMKSGIIDPTKVIRCCLENAASVARTFLTSDVVVTEIPEDAATVAA